MTDFHQATDFHDADSLPADDAARMEAPPPDDLIRNQPLVPPDSTAGRALVTVVAILTFLAALAAGSAQLVATASSNWSSTISREATIQIKPDPRRDIEQDIAQADSIARSYDAVASTQVYSRQESERLLEPWLGVNADFSELPVPRIIVLSLKPVEGNLQGDLQADLGELRQQLADSIPSATLDDHRNWIERLSAMAGTVVMVAILIVALVLAAAALAIASTTRGAVAGDRHILEVLHFVGADDRFIAREYQARFFRLGLRGGLIGSIAAMLFLGGAALMASYWRASPGGDQLQALFGAFDMGLRGYLAMIAMAAVVAIVTAIVSGLTVRRHLERLQ